MKLTKSQRDSIENEYGMYVMLGRLNSLYSIERALSVIDEHDFKDYLINTYRIQ